MNRIEDLTPRTTDPAFGVAPYHRSNRVVPGRLLAGFYPASGDPGERAEELRALLDVGVQRIVNLTEDGELVDYEPELLVPANPMRMPGERHRHPIKGLKVPTVEAMVMATLDKIDAGVAARRCAYVSCRGGRGRTATVVGCSLARRGIAVGDDALALSKFAG